MKKIVNFKFQTNVSLDYYEKKTDAIACLSKAGAKAIGKNKMAFQEQNLSVDDFLKLAISGHTFCNLFAFDPNQKYWVTTSSGKKYQSKPVYTNGPNKGGMKLSFKSEQFFRGAQAVYVDVDYTKYTAVDDYVATLTYPPTCVYMSYSDGIEKGGVSSRRFRLVYILDEVVGREDLKRISQAINDQIIFDTAEPMQDDCGTRACQYMNGVYNNPEVYKSDFIYSVSDFPQSVDVPADGTTTTATASPITFDDVMLRDMQSLSYDQFMHRYSIRYPYLYRTERDDWISGCNGTYQLTNDNYLQLWYYRERLVDGEQRRRKLGKNACLRRIMFPGIDANTLLFNLYVDLVRFVDNSDGVISLDTLLRKVKNALKMSEEQLNAFCHWEITYWREHRPKFIVQPGSYVNGGVLRAIGKEIRWAEIDNRYDRTLSIQENLEHLDIPIRTLYRYCNEKNIETRPGKGLTKEKRRELKRQLKQHLVDDFKRLYNPALSLRKNLKIMSEHGLTMSTTLLLRFIDECFLKEPAESQVLNNDSANADNEWEQFDEDFEIPVCDWDLAEGLKIESFNKSIWGFYPKITLPNVG